MYLVSSAISADRAVYTPASWPSICPCFSAVGTSLQLMGMGSRPKKRKNRREVSLLKMRIFRPYKSLGLFTGRALLKICRIPLWAKPR